MVFWHISNIPPMISQSQISCNIPTFYIAAIFVKYCIQSADGCYNSWANLRCSGCNPLGEKYCKTGLLPLGKLPNIFPMFVLNSRVHEHGTRQAHHYHWPLCRTNLIKMSLSFQGPQIWNKLVLNIDVDCAVSTFKNRLKMYIVTCRDYNSQWLTLDAETSH